MQGIFELTKSLDFVYIHFAQTFVIDLFIHKVVDDDESKSFKCKLKTVSLGSPFPRLNSLICENWRLYHGREKFQYHFKILLTV